jgi:hypothetical protein
MVIAVLASIVAAFPSASPQQSEPIQGDSVAHAVPGTTWIHGPRIELAIAVAQDTGRPKAIVYSDAYGTRLTIHRIASYVELPLSAAEYFVGKKVLDDEQANPAIRSSARGIHGTIASGLEALFAVNTVTGVWNLIEARHDPAGRTRRWIHSLAMLAADGGFVATAASAGSARHGGQSANQHRSLGIASMGVATAATIMMWLWKD